MKKIFLLLALTFSAFSSIDKDSTSVIDALSAPKLSMANLSEIATDIIYIPLQTIDSSLIKRIFAFKAVGNYLYVGTLDEVLCFDNSGKFLFKLSKKGRGPEEYLYLSDFDIDKKNTTIAVNSGKKIIFYQQTKDGFTFMNKLTLTNSASKINFTSKSNELMLQYSNTDGTNPFSKELINLKGEVLKSWTNYMKYISKDGMVVMSKWENSSYKFNNGLFLKEHGNDTIFKLTDKNTLESFLIFNTKDKRLTPEARSNGKYYADHGYEYFLLNNIFGSKTFIYYTYFYNKESHVEIYDQSTKTRYTIPNKEFLIDDIAGGANFEPQYCNDGTFYSWVEANKFKAYSSSDSFKNSKTKIPAKHMALKALAEKVTEFDNPIIILAKIK